jgi:hypothetical protein
MSTSADSQMPVSAEERAKHEALIGRLDGWATNMDTRFRIPFTPFRFGIDPIVGLVPGLGDVIGLLLSAYILWHATRNKVPAPKIAKMVSNIGVEFVIGILPLVGNIFDVYWRANVKNVDLLRAHLMPEAASRERQAKRGLRLRQLGLFAFFLVSLGLIVYAWQSDWRLFPGDRSALQQGEPEVRVALDSATPGQ